MSPSPRRHCVCRMPNASQGSALLLARNESQLEPAHSTSMLKVKLWAQSISRASPSGSEFFCRRKSARQTKPAAASHKKTSAIRSMTRNRAGVWVSNAPQQIKRMPAVARAVAQEIIVAAEEVIGDKGRLAANQTAAHLGQKWKSSVEIIISQEKQRPPAFQQHEDRRGHAEIPQQQLAQRKRSPCHPAHAKAGRDPPPSGKPERNEPVIGFEPMTNGLQNRCSTTELNRHLIGLQ